MHTRFLTLAAATALALSPLARAEDDTTFLLAAHDAAHQADAWKHWANDYAREMRSSMGAMFGARLGPGQLVKGAPYSADMVTEVTQTLGDGNVISRRTQGAIYRDGEGRTRQETGEGKAKTVFINDPVEGRHVVVTPGAKKAVVTSMPQPMTVHADSATAMANGKRNVMVFRTDGTQIRIEDGKVFKDGIEVTDGHTTFRTKAGREIRVQDGQVTIDGKPVTAPKPPTPPTPPTPATAPTPPEPPHIETRIIEKNADGSVQREEVRVQVVRMGDLPPVPPVPPLAPLPPLAGLPGIQTLRFESPAKLGKGVTTPLGMRDFEGVKAEGKQTKWTIPAGEIGNQKPIDVVSENWYSPDLQVQVYSRYNDPRTGESVFRLANIKRAEPSPDLFRVPDDYAVRDKSKEKSKEKAKEKAEGSR